MSHRRHKNLKVNEIAKQISTMTNTIIMNRHHTLSIVIALLPVLAIVGICSHAHAQDVVRVCVYENYPIVHYDDDNGPNGLYIDILDAIASQENWRLDYKTNTFSECLSSLENHSVDLFPAIAYSTQRADRYEFSDETVLTNYGVVFATKNAEINSILDLQDMAVGVLKGDIYYDALKKLMTDFGVSCRFIEASAYEGIEALFHHKTIQAGLFNRLYSNKIKVIPSVVQSPIVLNPIELRFAAAKGSRKYLAKIDSHLSEMKNNQDSVYHKSMDRWLMQKPIQVTPNWLYWVFGSVGLSGVIVFLFNFFLRREVHSKTDEIIRQHENLDSAIRIQRGERKNVCKPL